MEKDSSISKQGGALNLALIIILVVVVGAGVFFAVRYFGAKDDLDRVRDELATCNSITKNCIEQNDDGDTSGGGNGDVGGGGEVVTDEWPETKYLNINEWGIRFKIPKTLSGELSYRIDGDVLSVNDSWADQNTPQCGAIARLSKNNDKIFSVTTTFVGKINGNSYYVMSPQAACGDGSDMLNFEMRAISGRMMFESVERIK